MEISAITIQTETEGAVEFVKGDDVKKIQFSAKASGIELELIGGESDTPDIMGWPWSNIKNYSITK